MELFGMPIVQVYLYGVDYCRLIATLLYIFFSDMAEGIGEGKSVFRSGSRTFIYNIYSCSWLYFGTCHELE